jgi:hypothetical protein
MSDEEFDEAEELEEELDDDDVDLEEDDDLDILDTVETVDTDDTEDEDALPEEVPVAVVTDETATSEPAEEEDDEGLDLDEELHPDDVEDPLDVLLQERTASATLEDDEDELEDDDVDGDDRADGPTKIVPRRPGEFLCSSCFLVLPRNQLADEKRQLCRDCA